MFLVMPVEIFGDDEVQDTVSEKFEPLKFFRTIFFKSHGTSLMPDQPQGL
jgi:hypothetical protein